MSQKQSPRVAEPLYSEDKREMEMAGRQDWMEDLVHHLPGSARDHPACQTVPESLCLPTLTGLLS